MIARWIGLVSLAVAAPSSAQGQTVQLPTFHRFGISTTVVVPDGGSMSLGGIHHAYDEAHDLGTPLLGPLDRRRRSGRATSGAAVRAWVHDFDELDARTLAAARQNDVRPGPPRRDAASSGAESSEAASSEAVRAAALRQRWRSLRERPHDTAGTRSVRAWKTARQ